MITKNNKNKYKVGELRPSQLLYTYGIGSVIDLPNLSAMVMGLDDWDITHTLEIGESRLLQAVQYQVGQEVGKLLGFPAMQSLPGTQPSPFDESQTVGVPVAPFPRWLVCPRCRLLAPIESTLFQLKADPFRPDKIRYVHINCNKANMPPVLPARFLVSCEAGHLDDFPWVNFVHRGETSCSGNSSSLYLREIGVTGEAAGIQVECTCGKTRRMSDAIGLEGQKTLPPCLGRHPHLRDYAEQGCERPLRTITLGASNSWFPVTLSTLAIPKAPDKLGQLVDSHWHILQNVESQQNIALLRQINQLAHFSGFSDAEIWDRVQKKKAGVEDEPSSKPSTLKVPEWEVLTNPRSAGSNPDFKVTPVDPPVGYEHLIQQVVLVERFREVRAITGFTRIESPGDLSEEDGNLEERIAPLSRKTPKWVPAVEVRGEGIFIEFNEEALNRWLTKEAIQSHSEAFFETHKHWRELRHMPDPQSGYPGMRFALLHSFSHALMRQLALECGYSAASIRERIYSLPPEAEDGPMAGILLYTSAPDSEGTLGGLVGLGSPEDLGIHIDGALNAMRLCASDPLCAEHSGRDDNSLHWAACHACLFAPETSCERGNKYLDRSLLVPTVDKADLAYFD